MHKMSSMNWLSYFYSSSPDRGIVNCQWRPPSFMPCLVFDEKRRGWRDGSKAKNMGHLTFFQKKKGAGSFNLFGKEVQEEVKWSRGAVFCSILLSQSTQNWIEMRNCGSFTSFQRTKQPEVNYSSSTRGSNHIGLSHCPPNFFPGNIVSGRNVEDIIP